MRGIKKKKKKKVTRVGKRKSICCNLEERQTSRLIEKTGRTGQKEEKEEDWHTC